VEETALVKENDFINLEKAQRALFICKWLLLKPYKTLLPFLKS
jgi:hypothetical protein